VPKKDSKKDDGEAELRKAMEKAREIAKGGQVYPDRVGLDSKKKKS